MLVIKYDGDLTYFMAERKRHQVKIVPNYTLNDKMISLVAEMAKIVAHLGMREGVIDPLLRKKNRLRMIHSSLTIEQNTLTLQQVTDIIDGKRMLRRATPANSSNSCLRLCAMR